MRRNHPIYPWGACRDKEDDADGVTVGVADAEVEGVAEGADDVGADDDGAGEDGGAEDGADVDGGAEDGADEDGGDVGIGEAGMELAIVVGAVDMGVVAGGDALTDADARRLAAGDEGPPVAGCVVGATAETWAAGLDRAGAGVCPVAAVNANVAAQTATRPPMPNASGHHRRRRGRPPSPGGPLAPGGG